MLMVYIRACFNLQSWFCMFVSACWKKGSRNVLLVSTLHRLISERTYCHCFSEFGVNINPTLNEVSSYPAHKRFIIWNTRTETENICVTSCWCFRVATRCWNFINYTVLLSSRRKEAAHTLDILEGVVGESELCRRCWYLSAVTYASSVSV